MKNTIYIFLTLILVGACANSKNKSMNKKNEIIPKGILSDNMDKYRDNASTTINNATLQDSILVLTVSYDGGCEKHDFKLIGSKIIQKSLPPIRGIQLYHNSNNDSCREKIEETLKFNIIDFKYPKGDIMLALEGYNEKIKFTDPETSKE